MQSLCKKVDYLLICTLPNKSIKKKKTALSRSIALDVGLDIHDFP